MVVAEAEVIHDPTRMLEVGGLVVTYNPVGALGLRHREHPPGTDAWFPLALELIGPLAAWLADQPPVRREWHRGDPEPAGGPDVVDELGREWRRRPGTWLYERADGRGGVRTWRELTTAGTLVEAGDHR